MMEGSTCDKKEGSQHDPLHQQQQHGRAESEWGDLVCSWTQVRGWFSPGATQHYHRDRGVQQRVWVDWMLQPVGLWPHRYTMNPNVLVCWSCSCGPDLHGSWLWGSSSPPRAVPAPPDRHSFNVDDFTDGPLMLGVMLEKILKENRHTVDSVLILFPPVQFPLTVAALLLCRSKQ